MTETEKQLRELIEEYRESLAYQKAVITVLERTIIYKDEIIKLLEKQNEKNNP